MGEFTMRGWISGLAMIAVAVPLAPAIAQTAPVSVAAPDPARLAAAQALIERIMPAARRDAMIEQIVRPMLENLRTAMLGAPSFSTVAEDPKLAAIMNDFMKEELERSIASTKAAMPMLFDAMGRAYARRFTLEQLKAIDAFFGTPAGRAYADQVTTIMSDPDIQAAQRSMMTQAMSGVQERIEALAAKVAEAPQGK
jgi:hypothetical protein